jgi:hypothetical protein
MANIYDYATQLAGDPQYESEKKHDIAQTLLETYTGKKLDIKEINEEIKKAVEKSNKAIEERKGFNLGDFLVDSIFAGGFQGLAKTFLPTGPASLVTGLLQGFYKYDKEKKRIEDLDATKDLKKLKKKHRGALASDIGETIKAIDASQEAGLLPQALGAGIGQMIAPVEIGLPNLGSMPKDFSPGGGAMLKDVFKALTPSVKVGLNEDIANFVAGSDVPKALISLLNNPAVATLAKAKIPSLWEDLLDAELEVDPYSMPEFRNPYRGGY